MRKGTPAFRNKVQKTMSEFKDGTLHSGSKKGPKVTSRDQAVAIALNQARRAPAQEEDEEEASLGRKFGGSLNRNRGPEGRMLYRG